MKDFQSTTAGW